MRETWAATFVRVRSAIAPESVVRDEQGRLVEHDEIARLIVEDVMRARRPFSRGKET